MSLEKHDIKTNIEIGKRLFENLANDIRPSWGALILSRFDNYIKDIPTPIQELFSIISNKEKWRDAHEQFTKIRVFTLQNKNYQPQNYLLLAELVAKVTYNSSGQPAPFDSDSGHYITSLAIKCAEYFDDSTLEDEIISAILSIPS